MPQTGDDVAADHGVDRADQDAFALRSQQRAAAAQASGFFAEEIIPVTVPGARRGQTEVVDIDEHPRPGTTAEALAGLKPLFAGGPVTAGNASGNNDGAAALVVAGEEAIRRFGLTPRAPPGHRSDTRRGGKAG